MYVSQSALSSWLRGAPANQVPATKTGDPCTVISANVPDAKRMPTDRRVMGIGNHATNGHCVVAQQGSARTTWLKELMPEALTPTSLNQHHCPGSIRWSTNLARLDIPAMRQASGFPSPSGFMYTM